MTELSGTLGGVGLPAIVRFLSGLQKTGRLRLAQDDWTGEIRFESGAVTDAAVGSRKGLTALDGMLELLPDAAFSFESGSPGERTSQDAALLSPDALQQHLEATAMRVANGGRRLPRPDAVPMQAASDTEGEEPVPLDRGTLQTLLAVDGHRTVREIVGIRHSIESVWHLASLAEAGLVHFNAQVSSGSDASGSGGSASHASAPVGSRPDVPDASSMPTVITSTPPMVDPATQDTLVAPLFPSASPPRPAAPPGAPATDHCPKLGFEDDPTSSFGRPTRLHRCFAASAPMSLSLDQQRELCLSDHFGTCPRLTAVPTNVSPRGARPFAGGGRRVDGPTRNDGRVVRLPFGARAPTTDHEDPRTAASASAPTPLRTPAPPARNATTAGVGATVPRPTPLRTRATSRPVSAQGAAAAATATPLPPAPVEAPRDPPGKPPARHEQARAAARAEGSLIEARRRFGQIPMLAIAAAGAVILLLAALGYLFLPQLFADNSLDDNALPNARLVAEGTPVTALVTPRASAAAVTPAVPGSDTNVQGAQADQTAVTQPTNAPTVDQSAAAQQTVVPGQGSPSAGAADLPTMTANQPVAAPLFDERFGSNDANWPSGPQGLAQFTNGSYRVATRQTGQSATVGAPFAQVPADVQVTADFQKLGGPDGGGYGIIVRDQQQGGRDGSSQDGRYYVLEAGDKGEIGIWRRDGDHWVDLVPWQHADAVKPGTAPNELTVRAVGSALSLLVNGTQVATRTDSTLSNGQVGLFVGGDGNQVAISRFTIQNP